MRFLSLPIKTLTVCGLMFACLTVSQAQNVAQTNGIDVVYSVDHLFFYFSVYGVDVDDPNAEAIPLTHYIDPKTFIPTASLPYLDSNPLYEDIWEVRYDSDQHAFMLVHRYTQDTRFIKHCREICENRVSPDGRFLLLQVNDAVWLADFAQGVELLELFTSDSDHPNVLWGMNWMNKSQLIYWSHYTYFVYDTGTRRHYLLNDVLDPVNLTVDTSSTGFANPDEAVIEGQATPEVADLPLEITNEDYEWSPDRQKIAYVLSDIETTDSKDCNSCAVGIFDIAHKTKKLILNFSGPDNRWHALMLLWSPDGTRLLFSFIDTEYTHPPIHVWLYDLKTAAPPVWHRGASGGMRYQWLN